MPIAAAMANPAASLFRLLPASKRNSRVAPDVPRTLGYLARRRHEKRILGPCPQFPDADGSEKAEHAEH